jgi:ATP-binding cassette subfamily F protein 3
MNDNYLIENKMLKVQNLSVSFGGKQIFENINFTINPNEKFGLIGKNGSGKTTLFKILSGQLTDYSGKIIKQESYHIGYLQQHLSFTENNVMDEACLALPDYKKDAFWDASKILSQLDFSEDDKLKDPKEFSGGWQIRLNLAKLLISEPDLLLLDEPTNYLDILSVRWLKEFLKNYRGSLVLITHDRDFMDDIINNIIVIHRGESIKIKGNTRDMYEKIAIDEANYEKSRINDDKKREEMQQWINRFGAKATLASKAKSMEKKLEKMGEKEKLQDLDNLSFNFKYKEFTGNANIMEVKHISFGYDENLLFSDFSFKVENNDRICVIGRNGKGKSTFLKILTGILSPNNGEVYKNPKTEIGYFAQMNIDTLRPENTIRQELQSLDPQLSMETIMTTAGKMMFSGGDSNKKISMLSGGEKSRVMLGKILLKPVNLLILDEPTNHLDMESCEALSDALENFEGASIVVSHNEYLINNVANRLIIFDDGHVFLFEGNYKEFLQKIGWKN